MYFVPLSASLKAIDILVLRCGGGHLENFALVPKHSVNGDVYYTADRTSTGVGIHFVTTLPENLQRFIDRTHYTIIAPAISLRVVAHGRFSKPVDRKSTRLNSSH